MKILRRLWALFLLLIVLLIESILMLSLAVFIFTGQLIFLFITIFSKQDLVADEYFVKYTKKDFSIFKKRVNKFCDTLLSSIFFPFTN